MPLKYFYGKRSKMSLKYLLALMLAGGTLSVPTVAYSERVVGSLPMDDNFDSNAYESDLVWTSVGAREEWQPNGGWRGTGAAKFYPPTGEGYSGLG
jgi:hypothetical protein